MRRTLVTGLGVLLLAAVYAQADVMVQWGAPGGEDIVSAGTFPPEPPNTYNPATVISPTVGDNGYYITDSANRTPTFYGADNWADGGTDTRVESYDVIRLRFNGGVGSTIKAMYVWQKQDFMTEKTATVTNFSFKCTSNEAVTNRWLVEKDAQFYISQETFGTGLVETNASALSWNEFTPFSNSVAVIGGSTSVTLHDLDSVGVYLDVTRTTAGGVWQDMRYISYFAVQGIPDPAGTVVSIK